MKRKNTKHCSNGSVFSRMEKGDAANKSKPRTIGLGDRLKRLIDCVNRLDGKKKPKVLDMIASGLAFVKEKD